MSTTTEATIEDLYHVEGKAEIVNGEIVLMSPTGDLPSSAAGEIFVSLRNHARTTSSGRAYAGSTGFVVNLPHRKSFCPDLSYYIGPPTPAQFLNRAPASP